MGTVLWSIAGLAAVVVAIFVGRRIGQWLVTSPTPTGRIAGALIRLEKESPKLYASAAVVERVRTELNGEVTAEQVLALLSLSRRWQPDTWERAKANYAALEKAVAERPGLKARLEAISWEALADKSFDPATALRGRC